MTLNPPKEPTRVERMRRTWVTVAELAWGAAGVLIGVLIGVLVS